MMALALLATLAGASHETTGKPDALSYYKTSEQLDAMLDEVAESSPEFVRVETMTDPTTSFSIKVATITEFESGLEGKSQVVLMFGVHARELISSDIGYHLIKLLAGRNSELTFWPAAASAHKRNMKLEHTMLSGDAQGPYRLLMGQAGWEKSLEEWVRILRKSCVIKIFLNCNPKGRDDVFAGDGCQRTVPETGVDLNRNWPYEWSNLMGNSANKGSTVYRGPSPLSEGSTRVVHKLLTGTYDPGVFTAEAFKPHLFIDIHSGEWAQYTPLDCALTTPKSMLPGDISILGELLDNYCDCLWGPGGQASNYVACGTGVDYVGIELETPYSLTFEVYGWDNEGRDSPLGR
eukprot:CAMPEP_0182897172 /NCGR_PEP_ID=MMETSP0034_2-20130328/26728_1 /TAXON_ID=156128 /ORGANISM="Nephroselmis pyriformis, Strain CCMP717" /LENGTH=348 /DNA_ID=CAMNT_0025031075 /DNA_START=162 /DNA_END=1204 /DNA_ORIENTATION=+